MNPTRPLFPIAAGARMPAPPTVQSVIDAYLHHCEIVGQHSAEAREERLRTLDEFSKVFGALAVADCRAFMLSDWIEAHPSWRSSSTRKAKASQVKAAFNWALRGGRIPVNPFVGITYAESEPRPPMPDVVIETVCGKANKRFEAVVRFLRLTACRLSELCELLWSDVDFVRGILVIRKHKSRHRTHHDRIVVLIAAAVEFLQELRKDNPGDGFVFVNNRGTPWNRRTLGQQLRRMKKRGLVKTQASLHGIRHECGTVAVQSGASIKYVSHMLGHSRTDVTERFYVHVGDDIENIRRAAELSQPRLPSLPEPESSLDGGAVG